MFVSGYPELGEERESTTKWEKGFVPQNRRNRRKREVRQEGHLNTEELDRLISGYAAASDEASSSYVLRARAHLETCQECRELLSMHEEAERQLRSLREDKGIEPGSECPEKTELLELAAGMTSGERREKLMEHVT